MSIGSQIRQPSLSLITVCFNGQNVDSPFHYSILSSMNWSITSTAEVIDSKSFRLNGAHIQYVDLFILELRP